MIFVALGVLVLALLVSLGRRPLMARTPGRLVGFALAIAAAGIAAYDAVRGGWLGGSILLTAALWLATSSRTPQAALSAARMSHAEAASMLGVSEDAAPRRDRGGLSAADAARAPGQGRRGRARGPAQCRAVRCCSPAARTLSAGRPSQGWALACTVAQACCASAWVKPVKTAR